MSEEKNIFANENTPSGKLENKTALPEESNVSTQPGTIIPQPEIENMEVHHHPDLHHKPKKWKEYFLEFLMIFLAVTMGFFAESLREHIANNSQEKEYINSLISDLNDDIRVNDNQMPILQASLTQLDSLVWMLNDPNVRQFGADLYYFGRQAAKIAVPFPTNDRTLQQMKNSGSFRLIRNDTAASAIISYYRSLSLIEEFQTLDINLQNDYRRIAVDIFNPMVLETYISVEGTSSERPSGNPSLRTYDTTQLIRFAGMVAYIRGTRLAYSKIEMTMRKNARELIHLLKIEYRLEVK